MILNEKNWWITIQSDQKDSESISIIIYQIHYYFIYFFELFTQKNDDIFFLKKLTLI
jgi:hypothetical protein